MLMPKRVKYRKQMRGRHARLLEGRQLGGLRRVRAEGDGARLDHQPPDRGRPRRDDAQDQARRQGLDQHLSRQAGDREAGRDQDGFRQGQPRGLGRGDQARPRHVRARRGGRGAGQGRDAAGRAQASDQDQVRATGGSARREGLRGAQPQGRRAGGPDPPGARGAVRPALPARDRRAGEHLPAWARRAATSRGC